jgi:hypothetical protein
VKKVLTVLAGLGLVFGLAGCGEGTADEFDVIEFSHTLNDGRTVVCLYADGFNAGGAECDWDNAK